MLRESTIFSLIDRWIERGFVASSHRENMIADVQETRWLIHPAVVLVTIACGMLGLSLFSYFASNWQEIPRILRVLLLCFSLISFYGLAAWRLKRVGTTSDLAVQGLALIGTIFFGGIIPLISQMYHIGGDVTSWLLLWLSVAFLVSFVLSSSMILNFTLILSGIWGGFLIFADGRLAPLEDYVWQYLPVLFLLLALVIFLKNKIGVVLWQILFLAWLNLMIFDQLDKDTMAAFFFPILSHLLLWWGSQSLIPFVPWGAKVSAGFNYGMLIFFVCIMAGFYLFAGSFSSELTIWAVGVLSLGFIPIIGGFIQKKDKLISGFDLATIIMVTGLFVAIMLMKLLMETTLSATAGAALLGLIAFIFPFSLLGLFIVMILQGSCENKKGLMIVGSLLLALTCIGFYVKWGFMGSALLFLFTGGATFLGLRMVRRLSS